MTKPTWSQAVESVAFLAPEAVAAAVALLDPVETEQLFRATAHIDNPIVYVVAVTEWLRDRLGDEEIRRAVAFLQSEPERGAN